MLPAAAKCLASRQSELPLLHRSYGLMRQTKILLTDFVFLIRKVFAGCCQPLLEVGPSRRYLCDLYIGAWTRTPPRSIGASVRFFPIDIGLSLGSRRSARETLPQHSFMRGFDFGAAVPPRRIQAPILAWPSGCSDQGTPSATGPYTPGRTCSVTEGRHRHHYVSESGQLTRQDLLRLTPQRTC